MFVCVSPWQISIVSNDCQCVNVVVVVVLVLFSALLVVVSVVVVVLLLLIALLAVVVVPYLLFPNLKHGHKFGCSTSQ